MQFVAKISILKLQINIFRIAYYVPDLLATFWNQQKIKKEIPNPNSNPGLLGESRALLPLRQAGCMQNWQF